jgi:AraC-like DNA-binding protein
VPARIGSVIAACGICIAGIAVPPAADTLAADSSGNAMRPAAAAAAERRPAAGGRHDSSGRRDSLLADVLRSIAQEDSALQAAAVPPTSATAAQHAGKGGAAQLADWALRYKWALLGAALFCGLMVALWALLARAARKKDEKRFMTTTRLSLMNGEVQRACLFIEKQFHNPSLSPASVCADIVTGEPFLEAMFERELGMSIAAYLEQVRIHHAKQVIAWNPAADARFVASQAGFSDTAAFEKSFEKTAGVDFESFRREKSAAVR